MFRKNYSGTPYIVFDIGGTSVGAAIFLQKEGEPPYIVHATREWLRPPREVSMERLTRTIEVAIRKAGQNLLQYGTKRLAGAGYEGRFPTRVTCFVSAPWYAPHINSVHIRGEKPFRVTPRLVEKTVAKETGAIEKRFGVKVSSGAQGLAVLESQILSFLVNGYDTEDPFGQSTKNVELLLYTALTDLNLLNRFKEGVMHVFHADEIETHSFLLAFFSCIRDWKEAHEDFLMVDMSGEVTEVSVVRAGRLISSASYPLGRNFLAREIARGAGVSFEEALSLLSVHSSGAGNDILGQRFGGVLKKIEESWMKEFEKCISVSAGESFVPHSVFVAADAVIAPWVISSIKNEALYQHTLSAKPFVVNLTDEKALHAHVTFGPGVERDPFLMIDTMFVNKISL